MRKVILFLTLLTLFTSSYTHSQWVQQTMPVSGTITDMKFLDANTGWITLYNPLNYLKTTNGGANWTVIISGSTQIGLLHFFNDTLGYSIGRISGNSTISRTADGGLNWAVMYTTGESFVDMSFINPDTGWVCGLASLGRIWRTTDGCQTFQVQLNSGSTSMDKIFFIKQKVNGETIGWCSQGPTFRRTTNSGATWEQIASITASRQIFFVNKDTGWICNGSLFKSTDGGFGWTYQPMPNDSTFVLTQIYKFEVINNVLCWGIGGVRVINGVQVRAVVWASKNGGSNWGYQQPDTSIHIGQYTSVDFIDSLVGWVYSGQPGIHTTSGGGPIFYTGFVSNGNVVPTSYKLYQNYPNPFNPYTTIKLDINRAGPVSLYIYDILGREMYSIINQNLPAGTYEFNWDSRDYSSGVYICRVTAEGFNSSIKMILAK